MAKKTPDQAEPRRPRPRQGYLHDMEPPSVKEIDDAADELADVRGQRMALSERENNLADLLLILMKKHDLRTYTSPGGKVVDVVALEKVKVRRPKGDGEGE